MQPCGLSSSKNAQRDTNTEDLSRFTLIELLYNFTLPVTGGPPADTRRTDDKEHAGRRKKRRQLEDDRKASGAGGASEVTTGTDESQALSKNCVTTHWERVLQFLSIHYPSIFNTCFHYSKVLGVCGSVSQLSLGPHKLRFHYTSSCPKSQLRN